MCRKAYPIFIGFIILFSVILAILPSLLPPEQVDYIVVISRFFDIMIPILAVGALIKYLCTCSSKKNCCCNNTTCNSVTQEDKK